MVNAYPHIFAHAYTQINNANNVENFINLEITK